MGSLPLFRLADFFFHQAERTVVRSCADVKRRADPARALSSSGPQRPAPPVGAACSDRGERDAAHAELLLAVIERIATLADALQIGEQLLGGGERVLGAARHPGAPEQLADLGLGL